jgi:hypothetical protein
VICQKPFCRPSGCALLLLDNGFSQRRWGRRCGSWWFSSLKQIQNYTPDHQGMILHLQTFGKCGDEITCRVGGRPVGSSAVANGACSGRLTIIETGRCIDSVKIFSVLLLRDDEPARLNMPDRRPFRSFLLPRMSPEMLKSESEPCCWKEK